MTSTRCEWLRLCAAAGTSGILVRSSDATRRLVPAVSAADHLLLGIGDFDHWITRVRQPLATLGIEANVRTGGNLRLTATLSSPTSRVTLR